MSKLIVITPEELETIFDARLRVALKDFAAQNTRPQENAPGQAAPPYVSKKEAGRLLGVCASSVDNAARAGKLKRHYVGKSVRFDRLEVLALAKAHTNHKQPG
jgi:hypothetical protein